MKKQDFELWLDDNEHIWVAFECEALKIARLGFKHYSARTIIHFLRHHSALQEKGGEWKINNDVSPYLARHFAEKHPKLKDLFEYRRIHA